MFRVTPAPGSFRVQPYEPPTSVALSGSAQPGGGVSTGSELANKPDLAAKSRDASDQALALRLQQGARGIRVSRTLPVRVRVPAFGPSVFLASELTSEGKQPALELDFQRQKKAR
jgi:hypothetical protein